MGNTSGSEYGGILIRTEKQLYFAGDVVKGNIYLHIIKQGFHGKVIQLSILGKEKTCWSTGQGSRRRTHEGKNIFHNHTVIVHKFEDDNLMIGQFTFPFEIHLSQILPGSFYYKDDVLASLSYKVIAKVISNSKSINDIKNKQVLILREPIKQILQSKQQKESAPLISGCCIKRGTSSIEVKVEKNFYFPNEIVKFNYEIDNSNSQLDIDKIDTVLMNKLRLRSDSNSEHNLEFELNYQYHRGPKKGIKIQPEYQLDHELSLKNLKNPIEPITPSITGNWVNSSYYLKVEPHYEGCSCCSPRPTVKVPITVMALLPKEYIQPLEQPENWNPQAFQPIIIQSNPQGQTNMINQELNKMANPMNS